MTSLTGVTQPEINDMIASFRNAWSARPSSGSGNGGFGLTIGGEDPVFKQPIGYIGSFTYSYGQEVRDEEIRSLILATADDFQPLNENRGATARNSILWGGILNLSTRVGANSKFSFNNTYNRSADNEATDLAGFNEEFNVPLDVTRLTFTQRTVRSHQLTGEHLLGQSHLVDWSLSASHVRRYEPDRSDIAYITNIDPVTGVSNPVAWLGGPRSATRTFSDLDESGYEGRGNYRLLLGSTSQPTVVKVGGLYRQVDRTADSRAFDITNRGLGEADRQRPPEEIFAGPAAEDSRLSLFINANGGRYDVKDRLAAGYAQVELPLGSRLRLIGGARIEQWDLDLNTLDPQGIPSSTTRNDTDILPALALNYQLTNDQVVRLSASQTLSRPEYREIASVSSFEPIGGTITFGNPNLQRALIQNYDLRWEWYPRAGEVVSVGVFAKRFDDPIERVFVIQTGALANSFVNADKADNYGVELEVRKNLDFLTPIPLARDRLRQHHADAERDHAGQYRHQRADQHGPADGGPGRVRGERWAQLRQRRRAQRHAALQPGRGQDRRGGGRAVPRCLRAGPESPGLLVAGTRLPERVPQAGRQEPARRSRGRGAGRRDPPALQDRSRLLVRRHLAGTVT